MIGKPSLSGYYSGKIIQKAFQNGLELFSGFAVGFTEEKEDK